MNRLAASGVGRVSSSVRVHAPMKRAQPRMATADLIFDLIKFGERRCYGDKQERINPLQGFQIEFILNLTLGPLREPLRPFALRTSSSKISIESRTHSNSHFNAKGRKGSRKGRKRNRSLHTAPLIGCSDSSKRA